MQMCKYLCNSYDMVMVKISWFFILETRLVFVTYCLHVNVTSTGLIQICISISLAKILS